MNNQKTVNKDCSYLSKKNTYSISEYKDCLDKFSKNFEHEVSLKSVSPIFLDTNILLRYYSISFTAREKLFQFIKDNKDRIVITHQVQSEYLKNREDVIERFFEQVTTKIPKDFNSDVVNKMKSFLDNHKIVLKDYPFVETGINNHKNELESILNKLNETVELNRKELSNLLLSDKLLDLLNECNQYDGLSIDEHELVKKDFDTLAKGVTSENVETLLKKPKYVFPGMGDIKNKPEDPYGDYIIFHEILKYMLNKKTDVVFLTFDNTKGDWMDKNKLSHLHYVQNIYANTGSILYVIDAERTLGKLLNVDIESLVSNDVSLKDIQSNLLSQPITLESIKRLSIEHQILNKYESIELTPKTIEELNYNGYNTLDQLDKVLNDADKAVSEYHKTIRLNILGAIRVSIWILSDKYLVFRDGQYTSINLDKYHELRKFLNPSLL